MKRVRVAASRRFGSASPLRYPGGKAALAGLIADIIRAVPIESPQYVEPYAGGAGAGIALLREGVIENLVINDFDQAVYAFWKSVVDDNEEFIELIRSTPLTIEEWRHQREIYQDRDNRAGIELGFAFFYLNRTNRSGVLNAGVIGGQAQDGKYKIDARFNRESLADRIRIIGSLSDRIIVSDLDGRTVIQDYSGSRNVLMYIDPPYVKAGSQLYLNAFEGRDHVSLAKAISGIDQAHWLLTYDQSPLIAHLYQDYPQHTLELSYSANRAGKYEELLISSAEVENCIANSTTALDQEEIERAAESAAMLYERLHA